MKIIEKSEVDYAPKPNTATWTMGSTIPEEDLVTSCFGLITYQDHLIMVRHITRGEEIPGGHKEKGESVMDCFKREIQEEAGVRELDHIEIAGIQEIHVLADKPENYKYPYPKSYQLVFRAEAISLDEFSAQFDVDGRDLIPLSDLGNHPFFLKYPFFLKMLQNK